MKRHLTIACALGTVLLVAGTAFAAAGEEIYQIKPGFKLVPAIVASNATHAKVTQESRKRIDGILRKLHNLPADCR